MPWEACLGGRAARCDRRDAGMATTWEVDETNELISTASVCICSHLCRCDSTHQAVHHPVLPPHLWHELGDVDLCFHDRRLLVLVHYCVPRLLPAIIILLDAVSGPQARQMYL
jgi:hypothetical protein